MAARTMLYNLNDKTWSDDLCRRFKVEKRRLSQIAPSLFSHGVYEGIPLTAMLGDQQAALFSFGGEKGKAVLNLGTIGSAVVMTGTEPVLRPGLKTTPCYSSEGQATQAKDIKYLSEITYPSLGSSMRGLLRKGWCQSSDEIDAMCLASLAKASDPKVCAYWANATELSDAHPLGAPDTMKEKPDADDGDRVRAVIENIGNHIVLMLEELHEKGLLEEAKKTAIEVSGGVSEGEYLLQYIADVSGYALRCRPENEATAIGAALASMFYTLDLTYVPTIHTKQAPAVFLPKDSTRRKGFLVWQRLRRDVLAGRVS
jgi:glycerol kinase